MPKSDDNDEASTAVPGTPIVEIEAADWSRLWQELQKSAHKYRSSSAPADQRAAWAQALEAICNFLRDYHDDGIEPVIMLTDLLGALGDLEDGRSPAPLLPTQGSRGRRRVNRDVADLAAASAMIDMLVEAGDSEEQAARRVARLAQAAGAALPMAQRRARRTQEGERPVHDRLLDFRARLRSAKKTDLSFQLTREIYDIWKGVYAQYRQGRQMNPRDAAEAVLKIWSEMIKSPATSKP
jgi:hypothetical protein